MTIATLIRRVKNRPEKPQKKTSLRADVQGLRAFAVLVVIADHIFHWPSGGFVGVDIFFVISGFVITLSLLREHARNGRISVVEFYRRRVRRIMPAAALTLAFTVVAAYVAFSASRFMSVVVDAGLAAVFVANWRFASVGTDYFAADGPVSPLQHFWSLAVEEQFYFIWPFLVMAIFVFAARKKLADARTILTAVVGLIIVASLAWAFWETSNSATMAYFSTPSRAWELAVGALLALLVPACSRIPAAARPVIAWAGVAGMVASLFLINGTSPFPAPSALLPVLSAAIFIAAGSGSSKQRFLAPFTNKVSVYVGALSYSLYLWHFPIIIIAGAFLDTDDLTVQLALLVAIFVWSYYAFELVEERVLASNWLTGKPRKTSFRAGNVFSNAYQLKALSLLAIVALGAVYLGLRPAPAPDYSAIPALPAAPLATTGPTQAAPQFGPEVTKVQSDLTAAIKATAWPTLTPTLDNVIATDPVPPGIGPCGAVSPPSAEECTWGDLDAPNTAIIIGDSVAQTYIPALREIYGTGDWNLRGMSMYACRALDLAFEAPTEELQDGCEQRKQDVVDAVNTTSPDLVIVVNSYYMAANLIGTERRATSADWGPAMKSYLSKMSGSGANFTLITPPPADKNPSVCATKQSTPADCVGRITDDWKAMAKSDRELMASMGGRFIDSSSLFCVSTYCPAFSSTLPIKRDVTHIIPDYAMKIVPGLRELLT